jgi:hypothetical protein
LNGQFRSLEARLSRLEQVTKREADDNPNQVQRERVDKLSLVYAWWVEADIGDMSSARLSSFVSLRKRSPPGPGAAVALAAAYAAENTNALAKYADSAGDPFTRGYAYVLMTRIEPSAVMVEKAIAELQTALEEATEGAPARHEPIGRIALQLSRSLYVKGRLTGSTRWFELAEAAAGTARRELQLINEPLFWAAAHRTTSEIYDAMRQRLGPGEEVKARLLEARSNRAYALSLL